MMLTEQLTLHTLEDFYLGRQVWRLWVTLAGRQLRNTLRCFAGKKCSQGLYITVKDSHKLPSSQSPGFCLCPQSSAQRYSEEKYADTGSTSTPLFRAHLKGKGVSRDASLWASCLWLWEWALFCGWCDKRKLAWKICTGMCVSGLHLGFC